VTLSFEWDAQKAARNLAKHRVSFEEASTAFGDLSGRIMIDPGHSVEEERFVLLGISQRHRLLAVIFVERGEAIRLISARRATRREWRDYEESASKSN